MSTHRQLTGTQLHEPYHFVQESDPGAVGSALYWLKVSTGAVKRRNSGNNGWDNIGAGSFVDPSITLGDLIVNDGAAPDRLGVGADDQVLTADSGEPLGMKWASPGAGSLPTWLSNHPDNPPVSANAKDDEFTTSATLPGGGSAIWSWNNQQAATATIANDCLILQSVTYGQRILLQQPISGNFTIMAKVVMGGGVANYNDIGIHVGDSVTGKHMSIGLHCDTGGTIINNVAVQKWTDSTTFGTQVAVLYPIQNPLKYFKIVVDSTNITFYYSAAGVNWEQVFQEAKATYLTGARDRIGLHIRPNGSYVSLTSDWFRVL